MNKIKYIFQLKNIFYLITYKNNEFVTNDNKKGEKQWEEEGKESPKDL